MVCTGMDAARARASGMSGHLLDEDYLSDMVNVEDQLLYLDLISSLCVDQDDNGIREIQDLIRAKIFGGEFGGMLGIGEENEDERHLGEPYLAFISGDNSTRHFSSHI